MASCALGTSLLPQPFNQDVTQLYNAPYSLVRFLQFNAHPYIVIDLPVQTRGSCSLCIRRVRGYYIMQILYNICVCILLRFRTRL
jgi:hypothetical protein